MTTPMITRMSLLSTQVCVPAHWSDEQIIEFCEQKNPSGTTNGWFIHHKGEEDERVQCEEHVEHIHVVLVV